MQEEVDNWISQFEEGYWNPLSMMARLAEEVGELAREIPKNLMNLWAIWPLNWPIFYLF